MRPIPHLIWLSLHARSFFPSRLGRTRFSDLVQPRLYAKRVHALIYPLGLCCLILLDILTCVDISAGQPQSFRVLQADTTRLVISFAAPSHTSSPSVRGETGHGHFVSLIGIPLSGSTQVTVLSSVAFDPKSKPPPDSVVTVRPSGLMRSQRIGRITVDPRIQSATFRIDLRPDNSGGTDNISIPTSSYIETYLQSTLLNYEQAKPWRQPPEPIATAPAASVSELLRFKIPTYQTGMYRIIAEDFNLADVSLNDVDLKTLRMSNGGQDVGIYVFDLDKDDRFGKDDFIVFYGQKLANNKFTDENTYWLSWGAPEFGLTIETTQVKEVDVSLKTSGLSVAKAFKTTIHKEKDRFYDPLVEVRSELADHYFWTTLTGVNVAAIRQKDFRVDFPRTVPRLSTNRDGEMRVKLQGRSIKQNATHRARIILNGHELLPRVEWRKQGAPLVVRKIPQRKMIFDDHPNFLNIVCEDENDTPINKVDFYLDWFEFDYWRTFKASGDTILFNSEVDPIPKTNIIQYKATNFNNEQIDVYRIINGSIDARLVGGEMALEKGSHTVTFQDKIAQRTEYAALTRQAYMYISTLIPAKPSDLRRPANQADYIVISHENFIENIQPLVEFRRSQGLKVKVVDIDEVYDLFSGGIFNPHAIQKFLRYTYTNWQKPAPTYVLLVGDTHYDYKRATIERYREEFGAPYDLYPNFVPTFHGWSPESGETAMDQRFVNISGDDSIPDMFIGRLAVQRAHELSTVVEKIINYEKNPKIGAWQARIMQVADNEIDNPGQDDIFELSRENVIDNFIPLGYDTRKIYLRKIVSPRKTNQLIKENFDQGVLIAEYSGHGGTHQWADESIFRLQDAQLMFNEYLPFIITTTCLNGQFDKPLQYGELGLSEAFINSRHGAIASLAASRLTYGYGNALFDEDLFTAMFTVNPSVVGAIVGHAKTRFISEAAFHYIPGAEQYILFGDPATKLAIPDLHINVELESIALDPNQEIVIKNSVVGTNSLNQATGKFDFQSVVNFSTESMSAVATFPSADDVNLTRKREQIRVWQGEFGAIQIPVPRGVQPGLGSVRVFATDKKRTAIGGARFWTYQPIVIEIDQTMDDEVKKTLEIYAQVVDNDGQPGIKSVEVLWMDTQHFVDHVARMIPAPNYGKPTVNRGSWFKLEKPIPLPKSGKTIRYEIKVVDQTSHNTKTEVQRAEVPEGANLAIASMSEVGTPIRYKFSKADNAYILTADIENIGGKPVNIPIEIWFSEGDLDKNSDFEIDEDANVFGFKVVNPTQWKNHKPIGKGGALQSFTVQLQLDQPLSTGAHKVYVLADPEGPEDDHNDSIYGKLDEPRSFDNTGYSIFVVNEYTLKPNEPLLALSLDRILDLQFPANAIVTNENIPVSIENSEAKQTFQKELKEAPLPRIATLRALRTTTGPLAYTIQLNAKEVNLAKPIDLKLRFDIDQMEQIVQKKYTLVPGMDGFQKALKREVQWLSFYKWRKDLKLWERLPSEVGYNPDYDPLQNEVEPEPPAEQEDQPDQAIDTRRNSILSQERFVTPTQAENTGTQRLLKHQIRVDPHMTPAAQWVLFLINSYQYEVMMKPNGADNIEKLGKTGRVGDTYRDEVIGIQISIPDPKTPFEYGDTLIFGTELGADKEIHIETTRNQNLGNGTAHVEASPDYPERFQTGDWILFFHDSDIYEIRDSFNDPLRYSFGMLITGEVNLPLILKEIGVDILVMAGDKPFGFGDTIKFSTTKVGVVTATVQPEEFTFDTVTLLYSQDWFPPKFQIWIDGSVQALKSVIPPRPEISILLEDSSGVKLETLSMSFSRDGSPFQEIKDLQIPADSSLTAVPIRYKPILFPGYYIFRIHAEDYNGYQLGNGPFYDFVYIVEKNPDLQPPEIIVLVDKELLINQAVLTTQPQFEIHVKDDYEVVDETVELLLGQQNEPLQIIPKSEYQVFPTEKIRTIVHFSPNLGNDIYQIQVRASDTSKNVSEMPALTFELEEMVRIDHFVNVPNPVILDTIFTYNLAQAADQVTIKVYTVLGRLIRTLEDVSAQRGYNEAFWDIRDELGNPLANGTYFYKITARTESGVTDGSTVNSIGKLAILR